MSRSRNINFIQERLLMKKFAIFATYFCFIMSIFTNSASHSQEIGSKPQISGTINFDEIREKYEKQHEWKIQEHNYYFNQFLKFYEDNSVFPLIFIGDFEARIYYMNLQIKDPNDVHIPLEDAKIRSNGEFSILDLPSNLTETVVFRIPTSCMYIVDSSAGLRNGFEKQLFVSSFVDTYAIYTNEIEDVKDSVKLIYSLASQTPAIKSTEVKQERAILYGSFKEYLDDGYLLNHLSPRYEYLKNDKKLSIDNYKYRYLILIERTQEDRQTLSHLCKVLSFATFTKETK